MLQESFDALNGAQSHFVTFESQVAVNNRERSGIDHPGTFVLSDLAALAANTGL